MLTAVNFHYIRPQFTDPYPGIHGVTPGEFEAQLDLLSRSFNYVSGADLDDAIKGSRLLPDNALIVTFDDGLQEQYDFAWPILQRKGIPVIFYVNTRPIVEKSLSHVHQLHMVRAHTAPQKLEKHINMALQETHEPVLPDLDALAQRQYRYDELSTAKLKYLLNFVLSDQQRSLLITSLFQEIFTGRERELSERFYMPSEIVAKLSYYGCIGTHGHDHLPLAQLERPEIRRQISESLKHLASWGCESIQGVSYPYGGRTAVSSEVASIASDLGLRFGFTMERATNPSLSFPLFFGRFSNSDLPGGNAASWSIDDVPQALPVVTWFGGLL